MRDECTPEEYDRFKAGSLKAYNTKMVERYDSLILHRFFKTKACDLAILANIGPQLPFLRVLDVGCATGRLLSCLAERGGRHLCGVDLAPNILEVARTKLVAVDTEAELKCADAEDVLPWGDCQFDVAILSGVLHHFAKPLSALRKVNRVLVPGGQILIAEPRLPPVLRQILNGWLHFFPHDGDCNFRSLARISTLLGSAGFSGVCIRGITRLVTLVTAFKEGSGAARSLADSSRGRGVLPRDA